jgi:hypothetical protein
MFNVMGNQTIVKKKWKAHVVISHIVATMFSTRDHALTVTTLMQILVNVKVEIFIYQRIAQTTSVRAKTMENM